ncbi:GNAT family N-acetyltransferase [Asanoa hainanensis]|uniref:GNAT family N-acetyltransferase n=1 Tax=Asanoa hainanensis TaxID=560556 RepID=UPI002482702A|nr:GNAT family N-acetyltransferase [Asanoa hainanensis]
MHPATRRRGVGRVLMGALEERARTARVRVLHLDTATNQPEAMAFYRGLGCREIGRERRAGWAWTLAYFEKSVAQADQVEVPEGV